MNTFNLIGKVRGILSGILEIEVENDWLERDGSRMTTVFPCELTGYVFEALAERDVLGKNIMVRGRLMMKDGELKACVNKVVFLEA